MTQRQGENLDIRVGSTLLQGGLSTVPRTHMKAIGFSLFGGLDSAHLQHLCSCPFRSPLLLISVSWMSIPNRKQFCQRLFFSH